MRMTDIAAMAISNLWQRKLRTILTVLGVVVGTASIVIMLALGQGNMDMFLEQVSQSANLTQITVFGGGGGMVAASAYGSSSSSYSTEDVLDDKAIAAFKKIDGVVAATPIFYINAYIESGKQVAEYMNIVALDTSAMPDMGLKLEDGKYINAKSKKIELILGSNAKSYFRVPNKYYTPEEEEKLWKEGADIDWLNAKFSMLLGGAWLYEGMVDDSFGSGDEENLLPAKKLDTKVVGLLEKADNQDSYYAYMSLDSLREILRKNKKLTESLGIDPKKYQTAIVRVKDMDTVEPVMEVIKDMGLNAYSETEYIKQNQREQQRQQQQWGMIGLISLFVAAIGIANTMLTSIIERTKEIGVMKVLGCKHSNIGGIFLFEAGFIGFIGGIIGVGLSFAITYVINNTNPEQADTFVDFFGTGGGMTRATIQPLIAVGAIAFAILIGMISGIYPAWRAMKQSPLSAIRNE